jgi:DinB superfamily
VRRYAEGPRALREAWDRVPEGARQWRPGAGKWSAHEVVVHCADAAVVWHSRVRYLLAEKQPFIMGWDQDLWADTLAYHSHPIDLAFAAIDAAHANSLPILRRIGPDALARKGRHSEIGEVTVEWYLRRTVDHLHVHAKQIDRNVAAFSDAERGR